MSMNNYSNKELVIGGDRAAYGLKQELKKYLDELNVRYKDVGVFSEDEDTYYPIIAKKVTTKIIESNYEKEGILICGTGIGMAITANKFPGIYAASVYDIYGAERSKLSNDTNVITFGARITGSVLAKKLLKKWIDLEFIDGRSTPKLKKIREFEKENFGKQILYNKGR